LTAEEYSFSKHGKWTAGQQLQHIVLCVKPLVQVFGMDTQVIAEAFGQTDEKGRTYEILLNDNTTKLKEGGKAPERYVPEATSPGQSADLCGVLTKLVQELSSKIELFSEDELDSLLIPHPLLGKISLREMLYNAIYHVTHHQLQTEQNLARMTA
ncbi:MAG: hypothetical protein JWQ38_3653, partial [Flavipsychrobacter sp.]|nr:hypothetical protein [Flavipsychrobacter sp.]